MSPKVTPRDFFLWLGAMIAFYISIFSFLSLFFQYIDLAFPDPLTISYGDPYSAGIRWAIASLIVLFPLFLFLMRLIRNIIATDPTKKDIWVRRWVLVFTIFIAAFTIAIDLVVLINTFLGGEVTIRFMIKVVAVLLVSGGGLLHFLADLHGWWDEKHTQARLVGWAAGIAVVATIIAGFFITGTPSEIRMYRFDDQKIGDMQSIQWQVVNYWQQKSALPATLSDLSDSISGISIPVDAQTNAAYEYRKTASTTFELCATFNAPMQGTSQYNAPNNQYSYAQPVIMPTPSTVDSSVVNAPAKGLDLSQSSWWHDTGHTCFVRTIDPERYPPISTTKASTKVIK
jgi:hypothetical protein